MISYPTLAGYLGRIFIKYFLIVSAVVLCVLFMTSTFDILQKFNSFNLSPGEFWKLILFKIPYLFNEVSTLICFMSTFMFLRIISSNNELVIILSSGIPAWQVFIAPIIVTFLAGITMLLILNPIGTYGLQSYKKLDSELNKVPHLSFTISQSGVFLFEDFEDSNRIIRAKSINAYDHSFSDITILMVDEYNNLTKRIDAPSATLDSSGFKLISPTITLKNSSEKLEKLNLSTNISIDNLIQRFTPPEMIYIWNLNNSIEQFLRSGLVVTKYKIYYYKQLFKPIMMVAMSLIACWFITLNIRDNSNVRVTVMALIVGICTYFFLEMAIRIFAYSGVPPILATLLPSLFVILISNFVILHFQEA